MSGRDEWTQRFLGDLEQLVNIDSGSHTPTGLAKVAQHVRTMAEGYDAQVSSFGDEAAGQGLDIRLSGAAPGPTILFVGHLDTVFEEGTTRQRPFTISGDRALGPGVADDKAGLLLGLRLLEVWSGRRDEHKGQLRLLLTPDEEVMSIRSKPYLREVAAEASWCLVLEPGRPNGNIVTSRKGGVWIEVNLFGRSAHAGVEPDKGRSAITEAARQITALDELSRIRRGSRICIGAMRGGTRHNIVPDRATYHVDVRARHRGDLRATLDAIDATLKSSRRRGIRTEAAIRGEFPPMPSYQSARLVKVLQQVGIERDIPVNGQFSGGMSDGNIVAAMGVPTVDAMGPVGGRFHTDDEYVEIPSALERMTLLDATIVELQNMVPKTMPPVREA